MKEILFELQQRNALLYYAGLLNLLGALVCLLLLFLDHRQLVGVNVWVKPLKFFMSISIFHWTMGWYLFELVQHHGRCCSRI
jgi:hypothetical protein